MPNTTKRPVEMTNDELAEYVASDEFAAKPAGKRQDASPVRAIASAQATVDAAELTLTDAVAAARAAGFSWTDVAMMLGVTRQAARQRFVEKIDARMLGLPWNRKDD